MELVKISIRYTAILKIAYSGYKNITAIYNTNLIQPVTDYTYKYTIDGRREWKAGKSVEWESTFTKLNPYQIFRTKLFFI